MTLTNAELRAVRAWLRLHFLIHRADYFCHRDNLPHECSMTREESIVARVLGRLLPSGDYDDMLDKALKED